MNPRFIVYELWDPEESHPFYVGWNNFTRNPDRLGQHLYESKNPEKSCNRHKSYKIRKILREGRQVDFRIVFSSESEQESTEQEILLIRKWGRKDKKAGPLTNQTDGGDGFRGVVNHYAKGKTWEELFGVEKADEMKEETRKRAVDKNKSPEMRQKVSDHFKGKTHVELYGKEKASEMSAAFSEAMKGSTTWVGRHHTPETRALQSVVRTEIWETMELSDETRKKLSDAARRRKGLSPEGSKIISDFRKQFRYSEFSKLTMRASQTLYQLDKQQPGAKSLYSAELEKLKLSKDSKGLENFVSKLKSLRVPKRKVASQP